MSTGSRCPLSSHAVFLSSLADFPQHRHDSSLPLGQRVHSGPLQLDLLFFLDFLNPES